MGEKEAGYFFFLFSSVTRIEKDKDVNSVYLVFIEFSP